LYLDPLKERVVANQGQVWPTTSKNQSPLWLLIDIKSDGLATYRRLHAVLEEYADILTSVAGEQISVGAVQVVISGNRPQEFIAAQAQRYCGIDGRLGDLDSAQPAHLLPMISDNWGLHFRWRGEDAMPTSEQNKLLDIVQRAHAKGRVVRLWATPENPLVWQKLVDSKVDWINTDRPKRTEPLSERVPRTPAINERALSGRRTPSPFRLKLGSRQSANRGSGMRRLWETTCLAPGIIGISRRFLAHGISIAGVDLGEVRGSAQPAMPNSWSSIKRWCGEVTPLSQFCSGKAAVG
jgi:hypothetical protein